MVGRWNHLSWQESRARAGSSCQRSVAAEDESAASIPDRVHHRLYVHSLKSSPGRGDEVGLQPLEGISRRFSGDSGEDWLANQSDSFIENRGSAWRPEATLAGGASGDPAGVWLSSSGFMSFTGATINKAWVYRTGCEVATEVSSYTTA